MAKRKYIVKDAYLGFSDRNVYRGSEVELDDNSPGTKTLLDIGAIEPVAVASKTKVQQKEEE